MVKKPLDIPASKMESLLEKYKQKWRNRILSTMPLETSNSRAIAIKTILRDIYAIWNLPPPHTVVWCKSPAAAKLAVEAVSELLRAKHKHPGENGNWRALWTPIQRRIFENYSDVLKMAPTLATSVEESLRHAFYDEQQCNFINCTNALQKDFQHTAEVGMTTAHGLYIGDLRHHDWLENESLQFCLKQFRDGWRLPSPDMRLVASESRQTSEWLLGKRFTPLCWNGRDLGDVLPAIEFCRDIFAMKKETARMEPFIQLARHTRWAWGQPGVIFIAEPPCIFKTDERFRLHCENGPALQFRDGVELHAFDGFLVDVPEKKNSSRFKDELLLTEHCGRRAAWVCSDDSGDLYYEGDAVQWKRLIEQVYYHLELLEKEGMEPCLNSLQEAKLANYLEPDLAIMEQYLLCLNDGMPVLQKTRAEMLEALWEICCGSGDDWSARLWVKAFNTNSRTNVHPKDSFKPIPPWIRTPREALAWLSDKSTL